MNEWLNELIVVTCASLAWNKINFKNKICKIDLVLGKCFSNNFLCQAACSEQPFLKYQCAVLKINAGWTKISPISVIWTKIVHLKRILSSWKTMPSLVLFCFSVVFQFSYCTGSEAHSPLGLFFYLSYSLHKWRVCELLKLPVKRQYPVVTRLTLQSARGGKYNNTLHGYSACP